MKAGIKLKIIKNLFKVLLVNSMMPEVCNKKKKKTFTKPVLHLKLI